jgi:transposase
MKGRPAQRIALEAATIEELERLVRQRRTGRSVAFRAQIILRCQQEPTDAAVARVLHTTKTTVGLWRKRFLAQGLEGLFDEPRVGAPRQIGDDRVEQVVTQTLEAAPQGATHWSTRQLAKKLAMSQSTISRIWRAFGLKPHRQDTFVLSRDPQLVAKVRDIVGLYLSPPANALVLCVDEKSQIQALSRSQPILPLSPGSLERRTPDYFRHGITSLFAALDIRTGKVIGRCFPKHRSQEFRAFLELIEQSVPADQEVHLVLDNYATHKSALVQRWLLKHPRYHLHFTPTHASWLNQVERWFGILTQRQIKRGSHATVAALIHAIEDFLNAHNAAPKPIRWQKTADEILAAITRFATHTLNAHA